MRAGGPYFDDLHVGQTFDDAPALTLTEGHAAVHQSVLGDRLRVPLDARLSERVLGAGRHAAHPALVWDVAIGQSTLVTRQVVANLFYRGLVLWRAPDIGDTLTTHTEVVALRRNRPRPQRRPTGLAALRVRTLDQDGRRVLDFHRCAMLPLRDVDADRPAAGDFDAIESELTSDSLRAAAAGWDLRAFRDTVPGPHAGALAEGARWEIEGGDVVDGAPQLARLTLNLAAVHHDAATAGGRRLVYGGHTIGIAAAQATRVLANLVTILAWHGCDHVGPVFEGDTLHSELELERVESLPGDGALVHLRSRVHAARADGNVPVLDWRFVGLMA